MKNKNNLAIFASGRGSNFEALVQEIKKGKINVAKCVLFTDKKDSLVRQRAKKYGVKDIFIDPVRFKDKKEFDQEVIDTLDKEKIKVIALAGYMRILSPFFVKYFENKILNIHPSLLPSFAGNNAIEDAFNYGAKVTGVTIHFVSEEVDQGPIIAQRPVGIKDKMSLEDLRKKIHETEHKLYPQILKLFLENKIKLEGRHVKIT
ncbi:MAG: phosphoribosylglycinamide formyltransferase [Candidatus Omnitrophica bacterium]|nr:phosphoribosylglycinamide formyltransferase [Candidatus Omnitrophota bacterium]MCF7893804.1 phosphoribosylglycinamide formyltransferase [Candidatus Omnitrophota bacterium]